MKGIHINACKAKWKNAALCPWCGKTTYAACSLSETKARGEPLPGHFTICAHCGTACRFNPDMSLRVAHQGDFIGASPELMRLVALAKTSVALKQAEDRKNN